MKKENINKKNMRSAMKDSIVVGGLIGTMGLFLAKILGLLYSMPLSSILGSDALMSYYGTAYRIYSYILNVFTAGIPFALCTIVAKYSTSGDYLALRRIKKMSNRLMKLLGLFGMLLLILLSAPLSSLITEGDDVQIMTITMCLLSLAILLVPILSSYRGFWQGRKEMGEYAFSQTFEQIFRVGFLLTAAYLIVYTFNMERKYALYAAVLSTSVAAVAGIIQIYYFDKKNFPEIEEGIAQQTIPSQKQKELLHELISLSVPYLISAVIGYSDDIYNSSLLPIGLRMHGYSSSDLSIILSAINYVGYKLSSIPQILSPGFAAALIPHVTESMLQKDYKRVAHVIVECIGIVVYVGAVLSFAIAIYATDIYHIMYYTSNVELSADVVRWMAVEGFLGTVTPISSSLMIALGLKKDGIRRLLINAVLKGILIVPFVYLWGYQGSVVASAICNMYVFIGNVKQMNDQFDIGMASLASVAVRIAISLAAMFGVSYLLRFAGISGDLGGKLSALIKLGVNGIFSVVVYFVVSDFLKVPHDLFHKDIFAVLKDKLRRKKTA